MDKALLLKEAEELQDKLAAINTLLNDDSDEGESKEAAETFKCPECGTKVLKKTGYCVKCKKKVGGTKEAGSKKGPGKPDGTGPWSGTDKCPMSKKDDDDSSITKELDEVAEQLEATEDPELLKVAYQLDMISDVLEGVRTAAALESEPDEAYMKKYFKAGIREGDDDEKSYMNEFNNDNTQETSRVVGQVSVGHKKASQLPYRKIN